MTDPISSPTSSGAHVVTNGAPEDQPKSRRFQIGLALLIAYPFFYLVIPIAPFLPFGGGTKTAIAGGVVAAGEVVFVVAVALMGKEGYHAIKAKLKGRFSRKGPK